MKLYQVILSNRLVITISANCFLDVVDEIKSADLNAISITELNIE